MDPNPQDKEQNGFTKVHGPVAGIFLEKTKEKLTVYQAMKKRMLKPGTALALLEAQAATVGIVDPINNRILPVAEAVKEEIVGHEMKDKLLMAEKALTGYTDPYTNQTISVFQAMQKDLVLREHGLRLLEAQLATQGLWDPVQKINHSVEKGIQQGLYDKDLINPHTSELNVFYHPSLQKSVNYQTLVEKCIVEPDTGLLLLPVYITFKGLRRGISSTELLESKIINKETYDDLQEGKTTAQDVMLMESVKEYLEGKGSIAGIALLATNQRMSIYQAMKQNILMPGTAMILLEAQAATGFLIDPVKNKKFTVDEAIKEKLVSPEYYAKLLSAERAVTGYKDPYTGHTISLFQALSKDLIVKDHGIRLLEAQIATGGIIDPIHSHRLPTDIAFKRGYFDEEMNTILENPGDDTKGFFDPNTADNLTYLQLMERCVIDPVTGLCLLPLHDKSEKLNSNFIDYQTKMVFKKEMVDVTCGKYMGMTVSLWELLMSEYFDEQQRTDIIQRYSKGEMTIKIVSTRVLEVIETSVKTTTVIFEGIRENVTAKQLVEADIISQELLEDLKRGKKSVKDVIEDENISAYLQGTDTIAGVLFPDSTVMTIYEAKQRGKLMPGTALILLEAQAATGFIIDPIGNRKFSVDDAIKARIIGPDVCQKLRSAEKAVTGYKDPYDGKTISLFQAMQKDLIMKDHGIRLLEAQIATGGIIDPVNSHRIPVHVAYKRGYFDEEMNQALIDPSDDTKGFFDPNTHENLTYLQLKDRCITDPSTGLCLLPLKSKMQKVNIDDRIKELFRKTTVTVRYGRFRNKQTTLWDLINSEYLSEGKRRELFKLFKERKITTEEIIVMILQIIENKEIKRQAELNFCSLRREISVLDLLELGIVNEQTYNDLIDGNMKSTEVMEREDVRGYLQGKGCVAGVLLQPSNTKLSIYNAQKAGILTPGTALCLLEAQAASGAILDPLTNKKLSAEQALRQKVIGPEMYEKILSAERAVTGYTDPFTAQTLSPFQAMKKNLIDKQDGLRLFAAQIATGGIIDPLKCIHLPLEVAYRKGYFDEELHQMLSTDDTRCFFNPMTGNNLSYMEMLGKCVKDKATGLLLLPMDDSLKAQAAKTCSDAEIRQEFEKTTLSVSVGRYSGKSVSLWDLIHSGYFTEEQRLQLLEKYRTRQISLESIITMTLSHIERLEKSEALTMGLRKSVSAQQLLDCQIIDAETYKKVTDGKIPFEEVAKQKSVRQYLNGTQSIAGVKVYPSQKTMNFYEAKKDGTLTPGIAVTLLEAQSSTGWVIDPLTNKSYSVDEAARENVIGPDVHEQLLSAERAVTGYKDPYTDATISLFEAMNNNLIPKVDGLRLLEAQLATGGIIDPNLSLRLPANAAVKKGYLSEEIKKTLLNPTDAQKGFFDPNTKEKITYQQLIEQCEKDDETGLLLLPLNKEPKMFHTNEQIEKTFQNQIVRINAGRFKDKEVTLWEVLLSEYVSAKKREQLIQQYKTGSMKIEEIIEILTAIVTEVASKERKFKGLRKQVSASELFESKIISKELFTKIIQGEVTEENINKMESIQKYLGSTNCIAGVRVESTKKVMSIYEAKSKGLLTPGTSLVLLEAQAATGFVIDPVNNKKLSVEDAVAQGVVGSEWEKKLLSAERAVTGYKDPYTGDTISLFQALQKDLIVKDHGIRLLEAQIATGGIIDPVHSHRVPVQVAYQRGYFDEEMNQILSDPDDDTKGFFDPNTQDNLTYLQLVERCVTDPVTGLSLLVIVRKGEFYFFVDEATKLILKSTTTTKAGGRYQGTTVSLWDLLYSKYITEEKRRELVKQFKSGAITVERFLEIVLTIIEKQTSMSSPTVIKCQPADTAVDHSTKTMTTTITETTDVQKFQGIRKDVSASELFKSKIIDKELYEDLNAGKVTVTKVSEMESVRRYLEGTNSIAGVFLQSTQETLSIYDAKSKGLLTPGTTLVLLEAQAATGFVIDPVNNRKLSVEDAVAQGLVGSEWKNKLLSAERAVTGYKDPYTGDTISLFQALQKDLIVKDHGIRLLEAQIATGGIIDPVHSHRVPVQVAYQRGYFDEEMNQILSDPDDDTKGFFDPNTQDNLTYLQLVERCVTDPVTGLSLLVIVRKGEFYFFVDEATKIILKSTTTTKAGGRYQGTTVSLWDLLYSKYITEEKRRELVKQFKSGAITVERFLEIVLTIIEKQTSMSSPTVIKCQTTNTDVDHRTKTTTTITETTEVQKFHGIRKDVSASELFKSKIIDKELYEDLNAGKVTVTKVSEMESVRRYLEGTNSIAGVFLQSTQETLSIYDAKSKGLLTPGTTLVLLEAQAATGFVIDPVNNRKLSVEDAVAQGLVGSEWKNKLLSAERAVTGYKDPYTGDTISLFQALQKDLIVKDHGIRLLEAQIATGGIIDPVHSHRVPVQVAYQRGYFDEEMNQILSDPDDDTKGFFDPNTQHNLTYLQLVERCVTDPVTGLSLLVIVRKGEFYFFVDEATKLILKSTTTTKAGGRYQGTTVSLWDLLYSKYITDEKRRELVKQFKSGAITVERFLEIVLTIIEKQTSMSSPTVIKCQPADTAVDHSTKTMTTTITETTDVQKFHGIRKDVSASELFKSKIIDKELYEDLNAGKVTVTKVSEMESVRRYLEGTNSIAGVFLQSTQETLSIYDAKSKGLLTPGTTLVLLEAQAATGFVIDPVNNRKLSVEDAVAQGLVGNEWKNKLLSAERAVTGYKDPYTGDTISLFQALQKDLIVKDHGIRLLEAQIATGGIIDPVHSHRVPVQVAYQRGYFDEEMNQILSDPDDDTKGFFDPNTQDNLTYLQLVERCVTDPVTGLSLLVIVRKGEFYFFVDEATKLILKSTTTTKAGGRYQGTTVSLWDLLYSKYITEEKRRELVKQFKSGAITVERFLEIVLTIIEKQTSMSSPTVIKCQTTNTDVDHRTKTTTTITETTEVQKFHGIRKDVSASELFKSKIIDKELYEDLNAGKVTVTKVSEMESVRRYLEGTNSIAGVFLQSTQETLSIYDAKSKGLLTPGTTLVLLEAQAATGFVIDPVNNRKLSVEDAVAQGLVGSEWKNKLLSAERAVTGYKDPYTGDTISLFQALQKDLIVKDHGIRLLEAQIATGGIIDPVHSHRVPVQVAYQRGYFDEEMNQILSDPDDDTKGFFDPNTQHNLTYLQLVERCVTDPVTGLSLLVIVRKGEFYFFVDEATKLILKSTTTTKAGGRYQGTTVSLWDLLYSKYITEEKRRELVKQFKSGAITVERFLEIVLTIIEKQTSMSSPTVIKCQPADTAVDHSTKTMTTTITETTDVQKFHGIRKDVSASELFKSKIIDKELYEDLNAGKVTVTKVSEMESVRRYLEGTNSIAGVFLQSTQETLSIYDAKSKGLLTPGTTLVLLEAQAATGFVIDPVNNRKLSVEDAVAQGLVGNEWKNKLLSAERAVTGYKDPYTGDTISLFQALQKDLIVKDHGIRLLEAQIATGGIIDPVHSHRVPVQVAYQRGYFDEEMNQILSDPDDDTKGFFDPNTQDNLTYLQLVERCVTDPVTGLSLLVIVRKGEFYFFVDEATKLILKSTTTTKAGGRYQGTTVSLWDLLYSKYITEEKRRELVKQFKSGAITVERFLEIVLTIIEKQTSMSSPTVIKCQTTNTDVDHRTKTTTTITETTEVQKFHGIRKDVSASELFKSKIIDKELYEDLNAGKVTVTKVSEMESVRRYLEGTNSIAGVFLQSTQETLSIYDAKSKGLLTPGTTLVLLEAQAATGFVIDPVNNRKLSVEDAVAQGLVGSEWKNKLLSAERAVTGYKDPYTGDTISLFQALQKDLIVKDHGIRLLEAQIATGGIIDPVHSHRVPVQVAYQRGYFDEEMNQILSDPDDDTKGFFDPNTQHNLTYLQLVERCVTDPVTGLSLLVIVRKGEFYFFVDEATKLILKSTTTTKAGGRYQGTTVSLWDLLYSKYITEEKRRELVKQFKSGAITVERFLEIVLTIIEKQTSMSSPTVIKCQPADTAVDHSTKTMTTTITETTDVQKFHGIRKDVSASELFKSKIIDKELYEDLNAGKVTVTKVSEMESVRRYLEGTNSIAGVFLQSTQETLSIYDAKSKGLLTPGTTLVLLEAQAATGFVIDPVNNRKLSVEDAVAQGLVGNEWKNKLLSAERAVTGYKDPYTGDTISLFQALQKDLIVKDHGIRLLEAQIATGGIIDPVHSHRVPVQVAYQRGYFDEEMNQILSDPDDDTKGFFDPNTQDNLTYLQLVERCVTDPVTGLSLLVIVRKGEFYFFVDEATKLILKSTTTTKAGSRYQGTTVSLWDLLYSKYITEEKRRELVKQFKSGAITVERFLEIVLTIIEKQTSMSSPTVIKCQPADTAVDHSTKTMTTTITETTEVQKFHGIRKDVSASELFKSKIIDKELYEDLNAGKVTVTKVSEMESVRRYLEGTNSIAGVFLQSTQETLSIYDAKSKGLLTPGTTLVLLEAQAATGFVIDPVNNRKLSVEDAVAQGLVGSEWKNKLLSAERAVTGYKDPYTGDTISLFQALQKDLIVKDHGIRLLEAQIATGGIIDPVHSHRVPVQVAYQRGYFDEEMNQILSDPDDDTKGFFDPNTQDNLTYLQLVERCVTDPVTGLSLLVIVRKGEFYFFVDEATKLILKSTTTTKAGGRYQGTTVSLWDLLYSKYITEEKRRELVKQFKSGAITVERFLEIVLTIIEKQTSMSSPTVIKCQPADTAVDHSTKTMTTTITETTDVQKFQGIRKDVSASELFKSKIIDKELYEDLNAGKVTVTKVSEMESVRRYLEGTNSIAGVFLQSTQETLSIYDAKSKGLLTPGTTLVLLEAQAATGFVIDPVNNRKLSVEDAVAQGLVGSEWKNKLLSAERAVTGYKDPYTGDTISLFQALQKDLIVKDHGIRLLEAQIATGGIIDPVHSHRVPVQVAYQRGYFDEEMNQILSDPDDDTKGFFDPNTQDNLTYLHLVERCVTDPVTGLSLLVIVRKGEFYFFVDEATKLILKSTTTTKAGGRYQGTTVSLWDLLYSKYITEEKRRELVKQFKSGAITVERFLEIVLTIIEKQTSMSSPTVIKCQPADTAVDHSTKTMTTTITETTDVQKFHGIRKDVSASELFKSKIIDKELYEDLNAGKVTVTKVSEMESVRRYLEGTNSIAGVFLQSTQETLSIYDAKSKGLLTPGTTLVLLEAQAATGFVIDPVNNRKLSVEDAVAQGLVGNEWKNKLLSAERAVTGYKDPYTGDTISLFQALQKDLIVKDHGIRLLEAQIATGGIIDPVHSHRVPVQVAYQRGYFDEEMNQILSDPDDDTKGFFDPNTQDNLTYLQLVERCVTDPVTGLSLLVIVRKGEFYFFVDEATKLILKSTTTTKAGGRYQGTTVSLWDLLYSKYITEEKRRELVKQFKSGAITVERFLEIVLTIIEKQTSMSSPTVIKCQTTNTDVDHRTKTTTTITETTEVQKFHGIRKDVSASELFKSKIIDKELYEDLNAGKVTVTKVSEMESVRRYLEGTNSIAGVFLQSTQETLSIYDAKSKGLLTPGTTLVLLEAQAATGFVIDPVNNRKLSVEDAVAQGLVGSEWKNKLLSAERAVTGYKDPYTGDTISLFQALQKDLIVKDHGIRLLEAQIATGGIIDPVHSHRVPVQVAYQRGYFDEEMNQILSDPDDDTKGFFDPNTQDNLTYLQLVERCVTDPVTGLSLLVIVRKGEFYFFVDEATKLILKSTTTTKAGGRYQGTTVSLWDLLYSKYITEEKRRELVKQFKSGAITVERFLEIVLTIIEKQTSMSSPTVIKCQPADTAVDHSTKTMTTTITETTDVQKFHGIRKDVSASELFKSKIIDKELYEDLNAGKVTVTKVSEMESVRRYLEGTNSIAGVFLQSTQETLSIYDAKSKGLLTPGTTLVLLEAQAATGFVIDPVNNRKLSVEDAVAQGLVGNEWKNKLLSAERAVTGYKDPYTGDTISLFQALQKDLIVKDHGIRLLEAQIATGGIIDPVHSHRVPVQVAYQRGYFDEEMNQILSDPDDDTKGFFDPNTQHNLTYLQLVERCVTDPVTGLSLLVIVRKGEFYFFVDEATKIILKSTTTTKAGGRYQGTTVSLWDLLYSKHITEEKRRELVKQFKSGAITVERFLEIVLTIIEKQTSMSSPTVIKCQTTNTDVDHRTKTTTTITETTEVQKFQGIRKDVSASELFKSKIIDKELYEDLNAGKVTVTKVSEMESVRRYLEGTNSIAGVFLQSTQETLSIYDAKSKGLLTPGTTLVLLEAQAATGFVIDPVNNRKLSVEDAVAQGVVGSEWKNKLLSAERAVTGYKDPYTGDTISLFQALQKDLIVKDHGIRLLEAQIATGGIIDPVHSHRVPVQVAYQRGYFDEEMNQILSDPDDDTKGFFDPNTQENLNYVQLLVRCVQDPITGLSLLPLHK